MWSKEQPIVSEDTVGEQGSMGAFGMYGLLLWKNWLLQRRRLALTVFEFLIPILIALILLVTRQFTGIGVIENPVTWEPFTMDNLGFNPPITSVESAEDLQWNLAFAPKNPVTEAIMAKVGSHLGVNAGESQGFDDESSMADFLILEQSDSLKTLGGVSFLSDFETGLPNKVNYKIRLKSNNPVEASVSVNWDTHKHYDFSRFQLGPRNGNGSFSKDGGPPGYLDLGFLPIQRSVDRAIILQRNPTADIDQVEVQLERFPYPPYIFDVFIFILRSNLPQNIMFSFILMALNIVRDVVLEKERKLKESMKLMGLSNWVHWLAWFTKYFIFMTICSLIFTLIFKMDLGVGAVLNKSDATLLFVMFVLYTISIIMFCFAISVFFSNANVGAAAGGILFYLSYVPYYIINVNYDDLSRTQKLLACLIPNCCMAMGFNLFSLGEATGYGVQWSHMTKKIVQDEDLTMGHIFLFFIIDSLIAFLITWYIDAIMPGEYGVPKPWNFCLKNWYWCGQDQEDTESHTELPDNVGEFFEAGSPNVNCGIKIQGLRKEFTKDGATVVAVDQLNLEMYEGQITALLGHNGAGKTTTMFMITGFIPPTKGTVFVSGQNIRTNLAKVRQSLGLCPQHNVLFDLMTVSEHLQFFARLKGCPRNQVKQEVDNMIRVLHLEAKRKALAKSLSGGMKRKLSVGIALIAGSKVVVLDEPTSGMDPEARRQTWDILQSQRAGRTILLTTHFMDEADYLGDRIAIMAMGKLECCGSSLFLKKKYGVGYHMVMVKELQCNVNAIHRIVTEHVPDAKLESDVSAELSFILPHESSAHFETLFSTLEVNKAELGILSFGASITTMEEVFLKVGEGQNNQEEDVAEGFQEKTFDYQPIVVDGDVELAVKNKSYNVSDYTEQTGVKLQMQQFYGMFIKRLLCAWRSPVVTVVQLFLPVLFTIFACLVLKVSTSDSPALILSYSYFESPIVPYVNFQNGYSVVDDLTDDMKKYVQNNASFVDIETNGGSSNMTEYMVDIAKENMGDYTNTYVVGAWFQGGYNETTSVHLLKGFFNGESIHASALALNTIGNTLLRYFTDSSDYEIEAINHPLPRPPSLDAQEAVQSTRFTGLFVAIMITFGMTFLIATFVVFTIKERNVGAKHCQFVSGVAAPNFWFAAFAWDILNFMIPGLCIIIVFALFNVEGFVKEGNLAKVLLVILMYGVSVLPFVYMFSFIFDIPSSGYTWICNLGIFTGIITLVLVSVFKLIESLQEVGEILEWVFYALLPNYCFAHAMEEIYINYVNKHVCADLIETVRDKSQDPDQTLEGYCTLLGQVNYTHACCPELCETFCATYHENYFAMTSPGIGRAIVFMAVQFCVFFGIIFFIESSLAKNLKHKILSSSLCTPQVSQGTGLQRQISLHHPPDEDNDVSAERQRILQTPVPQLMQSEVLILHQLKKYYGSFLAVDKLSLGIQKGECFGLLGVNGAGKTTTFKMLTGDETISGGSASLCGHDVSTDIKKVRENVGYCPQFDALVDKMTVRETLYMYSRLRGVAEAQIPRVVDNLISSLLLENYKHKQAGTLSGGNKRKLSTAIALVGDSPVIFLDEPTTGMDPVARRHLWNTLSKVRDSGRTLILTSHSMEECEALCTRLAIMVNGQFKCLGSSQHLKDKFGEGYTLTAKIAVGQMTAETDTRTDRFMDFVEDEFPGCTLKDRHHALVMYQIKSSGEGGEKQSWARVFGTMERAKDTYHIEDYSVSQTSLEQVFINFARAQVEPEEKQAGCMKKCKRFCLGGLRK